MHFRFTLSAVAALMLVACGGPQQSPSSDNAATQGQSLINTGDTAGQPCGTNTCGAGEYCCNESCGICAPNGSSCTQQYCPPATAINIEGDSAGQPCGTATCGAGTFCCNESCGICAPNGGSCTQQICNPGM